MWNTQDAQQVGRLLPKIRTPHPAGHQAGRLPAGEKARPKKKPGNCSGFCINVRRRTANYGASVAGAHGTGKPTVVMSIFFVPQRQSQLHAPAKHIDLRLRPGRSIGRSEVGGLRCRSEVLIVAILENRLKHVADFLHEINPSKIQ